MNNLIRLHKVPDLHNAAEAATDNGYTEVSFSCSIYEMFPEDDAAPAAALMRTEVLHLLQTLQIRAFDKYLIQKYRDERNFNVEVFHSALDQRVFAYFDLQKDPADDKDIFYFGVSFKTSDEAVLLPQLLSVYRQLKNCSPLTYDRVNKDLYNKVFRSNKYFYSNNYSPYGRQLVHHNLKH